MERTVCPYLKMTMTDKLTIAAYECLGTLILVSTIVFVVATGTSASAIVLGLYCAILIGGHVSGAHFNPAVTLATVIGRRHFDKLDLAVLFYWIPQFIGGILGFLIPKFLIDDLIVEGKGIPLLPALNSDGDFNKISALLWRTMGIMVIFHGCTAMCHDGMSDNHRWFFNLHLRLPYCIPNGISIMTINFLNMPAAGLVQFYIICRIRSGYLP